jgi:hypothetical protein
VRGRGARRGWISTAVNVYWSVRYVRWTQRFLRKWHVAKLRKGWKFLSILVWKIVILCSCHVQKVTNARKKLMHIKEKLFHFKNTCHWTKFSFWESMWEDFCYSHWHILCKKIIIFVGFSIFLTDNNVIIAGNDNWNKKIFYN